jgi:DNA-binding Xre family transcriptional regulator
MLIKKNIKRSELIKLAGLNTTAIAKMGRKEPVSMEHLGNLCTFVHCGLGDIVEYVPDQEESREQ